MRCKSCGYSLWNLRARHCPECSAVFKPSDFEFVPQSVKFCCPHCDQQYFGTGDKGHLVPPVFECVKCHARVHMDEMVLKPGEGMRDEQTSVERMPWLEREQRGAFRSWFAMIGWAMIQPNRLMRAIPQECPTGVAWLYAMITSVIFAIPGILIPQAFSISRWPAVWTGLPTWTFNPVAAIGLTLAAIIVVCALYVAVWAATAHLILLMTGKVKHPLRRTCQALYYSAGASAPSVIPCCGSLVGNVWWTVSAANMLKEAQGVHGGRAAIAVILWPIVFAIASVVGWYVWLIYMMMSSFAAMGGGPGGTAWTPQNMPVMTLNTSLIQYAWQNNGSGPQHAIELLLGGNMQMFGYQGAGAQTPFCYPGTKTTPATIPAGGGTLQNFLALNKSQQLGVAQQVLASTPSNVVAYRFGDFIFTYPGSSLNPPNSNLWLMVMLPDPDVNGRPSPGDAVVIGTGSYSITTTTYSQLPALLQQQNQVRASLNLPPLPNLSTITHTSPALPPSTTQPSNSGGSGPPG